MATASTGITGHIGRASGFTEGRTIRDLPGSLAHKSLHQQVPPLRYPEFPVELVGFGKPHAPFFTERRTRGPVQYCVAGNPGTLRSEVVTFLISLWFWRP